MKIKASRDFQTWRNFKQKAGGLGKEENEKSLNKKGPLETKRAL
jgi:hypothetical protein